MFEVGHPFGMINYATAVYGNGLIKLHQTIFNQLYSVCSIQRYFLKHTFRLNIGL